MTIIMGVAIVAPILTTCGMISRSETQTGWAVRTARQRIARGHPHLVHLTDQDIVWLLVNGWEP